ncbi:MAG: hypothetical protein EOO65_05655, partial [Methanosarcinales archaeon]
MAMAVGLRALEVRLDFAVSIPPSQLSETEVLGGFHKLMEAQASELGEEQMSKWPLWSSLNVEVTTLLLKWITMHCASTATLGELEHGEARRVTSQAEAGVDTAEVELDAAQAA